MPATGVLMSGDEAAREIARSSGRHLELPARRARVPPVSGWPTAAD